jgi:hypothetical protein
LKTKTICFPLFAAMVLAAADSSHVHTDISKAPEDWAFAGKSKAICEEWHPRINEILFGPDHSLPFTDIYIIFEETQQPAFTTRTFVKNEAPRCEIHIARDQKNRPDDFGGMVIHELTHINQNYLVASKEAAWVTEGIADYVRHKYFEDDILGKQTVDESGRLRGYTTAAPFFFGLQQERIGLKRKGYLKSYTVAAEFLFWLEREKDKEIVRQLNAALAEGHYSAKLFGQFCKAPLDELWRQFLTASASDPHGLR